MKKLISYVLLVSMLLTNLVFFSYAEDPAPLATEFAAGTDISTALYQVQNAKPVAFADNYVAHPTATFNDHNLLIDGVVGPHVSSPSGYTFMKGLAGATEAPSHFKDEGVNYYIQYEYDKIYTFESYTVSFQGTNGLGYAKWKILASIDGINWEVVNEVGYNGQAANADHTYNGTFATPVKAKYLAWGNSGQSDVINPEASEASYARICEINYNVADLITVTENFENHPTAGTPYNNTDHLIDGVEDITTANQGTTTLTNGNTVDDTKPSAAEVFGETFATENGIELYILYEFDRAYTLASYDMYHQPKIDQNRFAAPWKILASADGENWQVVDIANEGGALCTANGTKFDCTVENRPFTNNQLVTAKYIAWGCATSALGGWPSFGELNFNLAYGTNVTKRNVTYTAENVTVKANGAALASGALVDLGSYIVIEPAVIPGKTLSAVTVNGLPVSADNGVYKYPVGTETSVLNLAIAATYTANTVAVNFDAPENGTVSVSVDGLPINSGAAVAVGSTLTIASAASEDFELDQITINGTPVLVPSASVEYTIPVDATGAVEIVVTFKEVAKIPTKLATPQNLVLTAEGAASWYEVENAESYTVILYKGSENSVQVGEPVSTTETSWSFAAAMTENGTYKFSVQAIADTESEEYENSEIAKSADVVINNPVTPEEPEQPTVVPTVKPEPEVTVPDGADQTVTDAANGITVNEIVLESAAANITLTDDEIEAAEAALAAASLAPEPGEELTIHTDVYVKVDVTSAVLEDTAEANKELVFDIAPMVKKYASYKAVFDESTSVALGEAAELEIEEAIEVTLPLPASFANTGDKLTVVHTKDSGAKFFHYVTVMEDLSGKYISFINANGFSEFRVLERSDFNYLMSVEIEETDVNAGDTITADITLVNADSATTGAKFTSSQFTLDYDNTKFELVSLAAADGFEAEVNGDYINITKEGEGVAVDTAVTLATATFTVKTTASEGTANLSIDVEGLEVNEPEDMTTAPVEVAADSVNIHNITVTLNANTAVTNLTFKNGDVEIEDEPWVLYAKYNVAGLYTDAARTTAVGTVTYVDGNSAGEKDEAAGFADAESQTVDPFTTAFTESAVLTLTSTHYNLVTIVSEDEEGDAIATILDGEDEIAEYWLEEGGELTKIPTLTVSINDAFTAKKTFANWAFTIEETDYTIDDLGNFDPASPAINAPVTVTATFDNAEYIVDISGAGEAQIAFTAGVTGDAQAGFTATNGTDVRFTLTAASGVINEVTYKIGLEGTPQTIEASEGVYTIPGTAILGDVYIEADIVWYKTVTFSADANSAIDGGTRTVYAKRGEKIFYTDTEFDATFDPASLTVSANDGYRLKMDGENAVWAYAGKNQEGEPATGEYTLIGENIPVIYADSTFTLVTVKTWDVTFTAGTNGALTSGETSAVVTVDDGAVLTEGQLPELTPADHYEFDKWIIGEVEYTRDQLLALEIGADTAVQAAFKLVDYAVTFPSTQNPVFAGDASANYGTDYEFTMTVSDGVKVTEVSYTIGGQKEVLAENENGIENGTHNYTISGTAITGAITVGIESDATAAVTLSVDPSTDSEYVTINGETDGSATKYITVGQTPIWALAGTPEAATADFVIELDPGYVINEEPAFEAVPDAGLNVTFSVKKGTWAVSYPDGYTGTNEATYGTDFTFTPSAKAGELVIGVAATCGSSAVTVTKNSDGSYTIDGDDIVDAITITYTTVEASWNFIMKSQYMALEDGTMIALLETDKRAEGTYSLGTTGDMYYSAKYEAYAVITEAFDTADAASVYANLTSKLAESANSVTEVNYGGDLNASGNVTVADSNPINAALHNIATSYAITDIMRLQMDVNGDSGVTTTDIAWIQEEAAGLHVNP